MPHRNPPYQLLHNPFGAWSVVSSALGWCRRLSSEWRRRLAKHAKTDLGFAGPSFLLIGFLGVGSDLLLGLIHKSALPLSPTQLTAKGSVCSALVFLALVWAIFRQKGLQRVWQSLRLPEPGFALIAVFFSIGIFLIVPISHFLVDRIHWAAHDFGKFAPPVLFFYFSGLPEVSSLMLFLAALGEEIVFRGLVQSTFVRRYGLYVGLFLTNLIWAATHFRSDSYSHLSFGPALLAVLFRVAVCLSLGYVLSWQTLRSGSVLPAAVTHTVYKHVCVLGFRSHNSHGATNCASYFGLF